MATRRARLAPSEVGRAGERIAATYLRSRGAKILGSNVRSGRGEVDLLVQIEGRRVAVEVKTMAGASTRPEENFGSAKASHLCRSVSGLDPRPDRVDLIAIVLESSGASIRWLRGVL